MIYLLYQLSAIGSLLITSLYFIFNLDKLSELLKKTEGLFTIFFVVFFPVINTMMTLLGVIELINYIKTKI